MAGESGSFWQLERVNRRRTAAFVAKMILVLAVIGLGLDFLFHTVRFSDGRLSGFPWFAAVAVILAVAQTLRASFAGAELVLGALGAHPIDADERKNQALIDAGARGSREDARSGGRIDAPERGRSQARSRRESSRPALAAPSCSG